MIQVWLEQVHSMDHQGSLHFNIEVEEHSFSYAPFYANCGETGEKFTCSCGFCAEQRLGHGCWQQGHNVVMTASLDEIHAKLVAEAASEARRLDVGYPATWEWLESLT